MAEQVNVCVKNSTEKDIEVYRELADGTHDLNSTIHSGEEDTKLLPEPGVFLVVSTPNTHSWYNTQNCDLDVTLNEEVVKWSVMDDYHWKMQISDNTRSPEVPLDVNVEVSGDPPTP